MRNSTQNYDMRRDVGQPDFSLPVAPAIIITDPPPEQPPWLFEPYWNGDLDLDGELASRFPSAPLMSLFHTHSVAGNPHHGVALLSTQDGAATVSVEAHPSGAVQWTFSLASMLAQRFQMAALSDLNREAWLDRMRLGDDRVSFLWDARRWKADYLISAAHRYTTNLYAFSPHQSEAAARLTPDVTRKLLDWLQSLWTAPTADSQTDPAFTW